MIKKEKEKKRYIYKDGSFWTRPQLCPQLSRSLWYYGVSAYCFEEETILSVFVIAVWTVNVSVTQDVIVYAPKPSFFVRSRTSEPFESIFGGRTLCNNCNIIIIKNVQYFCLWNTIKNVRTNVYISSPVDRTFGHVGFIQYLRYYRRTNYIHYL